MATYDTTSRSAAEIKAGKRTTTLIFFITGLLAIGGAALFTEHDWNNFSFKTDLIENGSSIFMKYFFIIVALERAASVWTGIERSQDKRAWDRRVRRVKELLEINFEDIKLPELQQTYHRERVIIQDIEKNSSSFLKIQNPYVDDKGQPVSYKNKPVEEKEQLVGYLRSVKYAYEFRRTKYEEITYKLITRIVFIGGLVLSIVGLSIVSDIIDVSTVSSGSQQFVYRLVDIIITGGLLGGGSKSFSVFVNTIDRIFNRAKDPSGEA